MSWEGLWRLQRMFTEDYRREARYYRRWAWVWFWLFVLAATYRGLG